MVPWLAEQIQLLLKDICLWDKETAIELEFINSNFNTSLQIVGTGWNYRLPDMLVSHCTMFVYNVTPLRIRRWQTDSHDIISSCSAVCEVPGNLLFGVRLLCLNRAVFCIVQFSAAQFTTISHLVKLISVNRKCVPDGSVSSGKREFANTSLVDVFVITFRFIVTNRE